MHVSLHSADLHYGGGLVLHTASSGSIPHLTEIYLRLDDGETIGIGEVRTNIAYLNGFSEATVAECAAGAVGEVDWTRDPVDLIATMVEWGTPLIAPVRMLIDCALHDFVARRERRTVAAWLGAAEQKVSGRPTRHFSVRRSRSSCAGGGLCRARLPRPEGAGRRSRLREPIAPA